MATHNLFLRISFFMLILFAYSCANIEPQRSVIDFNNPQETLVSLNQLLAKNPDSKQLKADIGWLYIRTGETERGMALLVQAPLEPSYKADRFFPSAKSPEQRREYYLKTLKVFDENINGTTIILSHIFTYVSKEEIVDPVLITTLEAMAKEKPSPVFFDALVAIYYQIRDWNNLVKFNEALISQIEKSNFNIQDKEHLSYFYYNTACWYSRLGQYDKSLARLKQAFSIDPSLMSWSFQDPDLENLRNHMGYENFKNEMLNLLKSEPTGVTALPEKK